MISNYLAEYRDYLSALQARDLEILDSHSLNNLRVIQKQFAKILKTTTESQEFLKKELLENLVELESLSVTVEDKIKKLSNICLNILNLNEGESVGREYVSITSVLLSRDSGKLYNSLVEGITLRAETNCSVKQRVTLKRVGNVVTETYYTNSTIEFLEYRQLRITKLFESLEHQSIAFYDSANLLLDTRQLSSSVVNIPERTYKIVLTSIVVTLGESAYNTLELYRSRYLLEGSTTLEEKEFIGCTGLKVSTDAEIPSGTSINLHLHILYYSETNNLVNQDVIRLGINNDGNVLVRASETTAIKYLETGEKYEASDERQVLTKNYSEVNTVELVDETTLKILQNNYKIKIIPTLELYSDNTLKTPVVFGITLGGFTHV